jgi:hypothetical protein
VSERPDADVLRTLLADTKLRKRMVALAISRLKPWQDKRMIAMSPTDVVQEAIAKVIGGVTPYHPNDKPLEVHLASVVNSTAFHAIRNAASRKSDGYDGDKHERFAVDPSPSAIDHMIEQQEKGRVDARLTRCWKELETELRNRKDKEALDVLGLMQQETLDYGEQARLLRKKLPEVKLAHKRIAYHAKIVAERARTRDARAAGKEATP